MLSMSSIYQDLSEVRIAVFIRRMSFALHYLWHSFRSLAVRLYTPETDTRAWKWIFYAIISAKNIIWRFLPVKSA